MTNLEKFQSMTAEEFAKTFEDPIANMFCDALFCCEKPEPCSECVKKFLLKEATNT